MGLSRRTLFGRGAAVAAAGAFAPALGTSAAMQLSGITVAGGAAMAGGNCAPAMARAPLKFLSFASWLQDIGHAQIRRDAQVVRFIDPDIACMALPLVTKVRWQQDRNYRLLLEERQSWFARTLKQDGKVEWWP